MKNIPHEKIFVNVLAQICTGENRVSGSDLHGGADVEKVQYAARDGKFQRSA